MGVYFVARRWQRKGSAALDTRVAANETAPTPRDEMDDKVDEALRDLE